MTEHAAQVGALLRRAFAELAARGDPDSSPRLEAELLLSEATGWTRTHLLAWPEQCVVPAAQAQFESLLARRLAGEPIAYLRGRQAFWTLELTVTPATLIPRPETELLVETALAELDPSARLRVADLGTGSGAIAAALATERPAWTLIATDRCAAALTVARDNVRRLGLTRVHLLRASWLEACAPNSLDAVIANPPYVAAGDPHLQRGDLRFEPSHALTPGGDGLDAYRAIAVDATRCLRCGGWLILEHGNEQGAAVRQILSAAGLTNPLTRADLAGQPRLTLARAAPIGHSSSHQTTESV
ncbi:MAG: peptide chain release factor N(5)-glutamine methyltransferase [Sphingobacteriia bacterium]|nr:peptide chain release factor N(5)-glutamine methyltransferase [Sphingobacteriia bacterium]NCC39460.1 peptide chain release factor N(5)-glutamine methyltransferase [Gammaproteobacteria bacterium]